MFMEAIEAECRRVLDAQTAITAKFGDPVRLVAGEGARSAYPYIRIERHETRKPDPSETGLEEHRIRFDILSRSGGRREANELLQSVSEALRALSRELDSVRLVLVHPVFADVFLQRDGISYRGHLRLRILAEATA